MTLPLEINCHHCDSRNRYLVELSKKEGPLSFEIQKDNKTERELSSSKYALKFNPILYYSTGALGISALVVSCMASMLLPAIGSIGVITLAAMLRNKSIVQIEDPTPEVVVINQAFKERLQKFFIQKYDEFTEDEWSDDDYENSSTQIAQDINPKEMNENNNFLKEFQTYIIHDNAINCDNLKEALYQEGYQEFFTPRQLLEELLSIYQSMVDIDMRGMRIGKLDALKYTQDKIKTINAKLMENPYLQEGDQEQKKFIEIIRSQINRERLYSEGNFNKGLFLEKKMILISSLYAILANYQTLEAKEKNYFLEKSAHAEEHAFELREQFPKL